MGPYESPAEPSAWYWRRGPACRPLQRGSASVALGPEKAASLSPSCDDCSVSDPGLRCYVGVFSDLFFFGEMEIPCWELPALPRFGECYVRSYISSVF